MMRAQTPDRHLAECGEDMPLDLSAVPAPRRASQLELLPGRPPGGQIGAEAERAPLVVASLGESPRRWDTGSPTDDGGNLAEDERNVLDLQVS